MQIEQTTEDSVASKAFRKHQGHTEGREAESDVEGARKIRVLVVEDNASDSELMLHALKDVGYESECEVVQTADDFADRIRKNKYDIILADYRLPGWNGMETVAMVRQEDVDIPVVLVSGALGELKAVECIKQGAADYVLKDHLARLPQSVRRAIEERDLRDENRRTQEELARSNRDLEQFAYVASHDLQEPLRMVATYTQLLAERYQGKLDENADKYIHYAVEGALRMQTLVKDLLAFSRVGRKQETLRETDCNLVVRNVLANLQALIHETGARIDYEALPVLVADPSELLQLFQNLIGNAIKFRGAEPPEICITARKEKKEWLVSIKDNGIGIEPQHVEDVFVIFKRLHTREEYPGSGIGLAICKKIVEHNQGHIWVESQPGMGSTFQFTWPIPSK
jgi:two-component system, sensor histidine kinase and response regulator